MQGLTERKAIVTGGAAGIGRAIVMELARQGAGVAILDIDAASAGEVVKEAGSDKVEFFPCDVSDRGQVFAAVDGFAKADGIDILVNNAAYFSYAPLAEMAEAEASRVIDVGLKGTVWTLQAATPHMIARGGGSIVNFSSIANFFSIPRAGVYSSVKGALDALTRQQAVELAPHGITVNALAPGPVRTPGASSVIDEEGWQRRATRTPLGRLATAEEVASAVSYLCSPAARSITGVTLKIDGAITIAGP